jgi:molybdate transport system ATP-binding protein
MKVINHIAIYLPANANKALVMGLICKHPLLQVYEGFNNNAAIFSGEALDQFLNKEFLHGETGFDTGFNRPLHSLSSGEQKKALLQYLLSQNPAYFIVDEVYDHLDISTQSAVLKKFESIAQTIPIIQIFHRKKEIFPFINHYFSYHNNDLIAHVSLEQLLLSVQGQFHTPAHVALPLPLKAFEPLLNPLVALINVSVSYEGRPIVKDINWTINAGEFWQLIGPNGSGKTTLLSLITGDNPKGYGQALYLFGKKKGSGETVWDIKQKIGYFNASITQHFSRQDSIEKMIISGFNDSIGLYITPTDQQIRLAQEWLHFIQLYPQRNKAIQFLTMAQQRMVLIARAMVKHPPLLILDEPTAGLDDASAALIITMIQQIVHQSKTTILYVSHSKEEGLTPTNIFELSPSLLGTTGKIVSY